MLDEVPPVGQDTTNSQQGYSAEHVVGAGGDKEDNTKEGSADPAQEEGEDQEGHDEQKDHSPVMNVMPGVPVVPAVPVDGQEEDSTGHVMEAGGPEEEGANWGLASLAEQQMERGQQGEPPLCEGSPIGVL